MPHRTKQDYVDFIAAHAPRMSVASLKRVARCVAEETKATKATKATPAASKPPKPPMVPQKPRTKPAPRVHFEDEAYSVVPSSPHDVLRDGQSRR